MKHVFNPLVATMTRAGISVRDSRVLEVRGSKTGEPRRTPVNLLELDYYPVFKLGAPPSPEA